jgi:hypothetical protein
MPVNGGRNSDALDKFGRFIVERVRDGALRSYSLIREGRVAAPGLQQLKQDFAKLPLETKGVVDQLVLRTVESALFNVLVGFQEAHDLEQGIELIVDGTVVADESGMLHGELFGDDGWVARFSSFTDFPLVQS